LETGKIIIISVILIFILILFYLFAQVRKNLKSGVNRFDDENRLSRREHLPRFLFYILASSALGFFGNSMPESTF